MIMWEWWFDKIVEVFGGSQIVQKQVRDCIIFKLV